MFRLRPPIKVCVCKPLVVLDFGLLGLGVLSSGDGQLVQFREDKSSTLSELNPTGTRGSLHCPFDLGARSLRSSHAVGNG